MLYVIMNLNHYFTIVDPLFLERESLVKQGFKLCGPARHKGQGTSAEFVLFPKNYFEYIWIDDTEASKNNLLKLYKRTEQGACPYGLCFVGQLPEEYLKEFITYIPPYSPNTKLFVLKESIEDVSMPLIFIDARFSNPKESEPQNNNKISKESLNPQDKFFIPEELKEYKIPKYFFELIY